MSGSIAIALALVLLQTSDPVLSPSAGPAAMPAAAPVKLQIGTAIPLTIIDRVSTKTNQKGDLIHLVVSEDVTLDGRTVIPKDTIAIGELTRCDAKGAFGKSGKLEARVLYLELRGRTIRLSGALSSRGESGTTETVLTAIAAGTLAFAVTGKSATIEPGTKLEAILDRDTIL